MTTKKTTKKPVDKKEIQVKPDKKNKKGRPSKYNDALLKKFDDLIEEITVKDYFRFGDVHQIALYLGIVKDTVNDWRKKHDDFRDSFNRWQTKTNAFLFELTPALSKKSQALSIFLLKAKLNLIEIEEHRLTGKDGNDITLVFNEMTYDSYIKKHKKDRN